jgi:uncharacterized protein
MSVDLPAPPDGTALDAGARMGTETSHGATSRLPDLARYAGIGIAFGIVVTKGEVISWYRIQEMFRFQSFHMFGILGSAMLTALVSLEILKRMRVRALSGEAIAVPPKQLGKGHRYWLGGLLFGVGWALTGACPGPLFALVGSGATAYLVVGTFALLGTWTYGLLRPRLPH